MKKSYNNPEIKITAFAEEKVLTISGYSDPTKTTSENVQTYISDKKLDKAQEILLTW